MTTQSVKLEELESSDLNDIFESVIEKNMVLTIQLPNGNAVLVQPNPFLKPLPEFEGKMPQNWKDAVY